MSEFKQLSRSVKGLTVLVTGAASGMGRATAHVFAAEGANVAATDISLDSTQKVADAITATGGKAKAWKLDVADRNDITTVVDEVAKIDNEDCGQESRKHASQATCRLLFHTRFSGRASFRLTGLYGRSPAWYRHRRCHASRSPPRKARAGSLIRQNWPLTKAVG